MDASYSIGLLLRDDGSIVDTIEGMLAATAGIGPAMKVVAVNGRRFHCGSLTRCSESWKNQLTAPGTAG